MNSTEYRTPGQVMDRAGGIDSYVDKFTRKHQPDLRTYFEQRIGKPFTEADYLFLSQQLTQIDQLAQALANLHSHQPPATKMAGRNKLNLPLAK